MANFTHGGFGTRTHKAWRNMKMRVKTHKCYRHVSCCERWWDSFENFRDDLGECPDGYSLERKDVLGDYCPENCCWIPKRDQPKNTRNTVLITHDGRTQHMAAWAREYGIDRGLLSRRLRSGWSVERALEQPVQKRSHG